MGEGVGVGPVAKFYAGAEVLVTGASGFVGRVLLEKLLRSCPEVAAVYVLLRPKRNEDPQRRFETFTDVPLFDTLKAQHPSALAKVRVLSGDIGQPGLGLSEEDAQMLSERLTVIMHLAASVRFDDPLDKAVAINVRGTRDLFDLALRSNKIKVVSYTSTTYCCNTPDRVVKEHIYPAPADWRAVIDIVESADPEVLRILTPKLLGEHANTYTFSKALAEHVALEYSERVPVTISRPSVVVNTVEDPFPGWIDNYLGAVGLMIGAGKGVVHTGYINPECKLDYIPVDVVVKGIITSPWNLLENEKGRIDVHNLAQGEVERMSLEEVIDMGKTLAAELPLYPMLYYPSGILTNCKPYFYFLFFFTHLLPAVLVDAALLVTGRKPFLFHIQRRIFVANTSLYFFVKSSWHFENQKTLDLIKRMRDIPGAEIFSYDYEQVNAVDYLRTAYRGCRTYLLKEKDEDLPHAQVVFARMRILHYVLMALLYMLGLWTFSWSFAALIYKLWPCDTLLEYFLEEA